MQSVNPLDEAAFTELYVQHVDAVYRICYSFLKNRTDAEDAVQEDKVKIRKYEKSGLEPLFYLCYYIGQIRGKGGKTACRSFGIGPSC